METNVVPNTILVPVMKTMSASEANRHFSSLLRAVAGGESVTVLSRGKPVAMVVPVESGEDERERARQALFTQLENRQPSGARDWTRDDLYDPA